MKNRDTSARPPWINWWTTASRNSVSHYLYYMSYFFYIYSRTLPVLVGTFFLCLFVRSMHSCSIGVVIVQKDDLFEKEAFVCKRFRLSYPDRPLKHGRVYKFIIHIRGVTNKNTFLLIALSRYRVATILFSSVEQKYWISSICL